MTMGLIFLPSQLEHRSDFYHQLGAMMTAGVPVIKAIETQAASPPSASLKKPISILLDAVQRGASFHEAIAAGRWMTSFDVTLLQAGEVSGRLDATCTLLAKFYSNRARLARQVISELTYPIFLVHFAIFIIPFASFFTTGDVGRYLAQTLGVLAPLYATFAAGVLACQGRNGKRWRALLEAVLHRIPVLGAARRSLALARLANGLEALLNAGVGILEAWNLASAASGSPALEKAVSNWQPKLLTGDTPAEVLNRTPEFPDMFKNLYYTGEISGQTDQTLRRLNTFYEEEGIRKINAFCKFLPRLLFLVVALGIAIHVVGFWKSYFDTINDVMK